MFKIGQRTAVAAPSKQLARYPGEPRTLPPKSGDELCFVLEQDDLLAWSDVRVLEQIFQQLLGRKVWILASADDRTDLFD